jgi:hypothetical protein
MLRPIISRIRDDGFKGDGYMRKNWEQIYLMKRNAASRHATHTHLLGNTEGSTNHVVAFLRDETLDLWRSL